MLFLRKMNPMVSALSALMDTVKRILFINYAEAQAFITSGIEGCEDFSGPMEPECVPNFIAHTIQTIFGFTGAICILMIILSGYEYILGTIPGGSAGSKESAIARLQWAITGFIVSALAFFIIDFVISAIAG